MPKRDAPPSPMMRKTGGRLSPLTAVDDMLLDQAPDGQIYELVPRKKDRSNKQLRLYWGLLGKIVEGTEAWPSSEHLHEVLMRHAGFVTPVLDPATGQWVEVRDSASFDKCPPEKFNAYMDRALAILSKALGFDVTELLPPKEKQP